MCFIDGSKISELQRFKRFAICEFSEQLCVWIIFYIFHQVYHFVFDTT